MRDLRLICQDSDMWRSLCWPCMNLVKRRSATLRKGNCPHACISPAHTARPKLLLFSFYRLIVQFVKIVGVPFSDNFPFYTFGRQRYVNFSGRWVLDIPDVKASLIFHNLFFGIFTILRVPTYLHLTSLKFCFLLLYILALFIEKFTNRTFLVINCLIYLLKISCRIIISLLSVLV